MTDHSSTRRYTCETCGKEAEHVRRGRPRKVCDECRAAHGAAAYAARFTTCSLCNGRKNIGTLDEHDRCATCRKRVDTMMVSYRNALRSMISESRKRMKRREQFMYLEARCAICQHPMWLDANAVARGVRTCSTMRCAYEQRWTGDTYKDTITSKNHRRRKQYRDGEDIRKSHIWERDMGMCHICGEAADRNDWHLDHITPLALGGKHTWDNVAVSHPHCNLAKGARAA